MKKALFMLLLSHMCTAAAAVFVKVDNHGNTTYTNIEPRGQEKKIRKTDAKRDVPSEVPAKMIVPKETQAKRDIVRSEILNEELSLEKQRLKEAEKNNDVDSQKAHIRNIELLSKEIGLKDE